MPKALPNGHFDQETIDALDITWNGIRSDAYKDLHSIEIGWLGYTVPKNHMTIQDLIYWFRLKGVTAINGRITPKKYDELAQLFPNFERDAALIRLSHDDFSEENRTALAKENKRRKFLRNGLLSILLTLG